MPRRTPISMKKGALPRRPQRHLGQAGQRRAVGAAASHDPDAGNVDDQKFGDCFRVQARGDIAFALPIVNAGHDDSTQVFAQELTLARLLNDADFDRQAEADRHRQPDIPPTGTPAACAEPPPSHAEHLRTRPSCRYLRILILILAYISRSVRRSCAVPTGLCHPGLSPAHAVLGPFRGTWSVHQKHQSGMQLLQVRQ